MAQTFAVMKTPTRDGVGISELAMSSYFSGAQLCASLLLPLAGVAVDRCGIRRTLLLGVLAMATACLGMAEVRSGPGIGCGLFAIRLSCKASELPFKTQVNYHWKHAKGRAMALVSLLGNQVGSQISVPLAANVVVAATGWRSTYRLIAASTVVLGGTAVCLARERRQGPAEVRGADGEAAKEARRPDDSGDGWSRSLVLRCPAFWVHALATFAAFLMEMGWVYAVREVVAEMASEVDAVTAVNRVLLLRGVGGGLGTLSGGVMYDRCGGRLCMGLAQALQVLSMALLGWRRPAVLWTVCVLAGVQSGIVQNTANVVFADYFGLEIAGSVQGVVQMIGMGGAACGPVALVALAAATGMPITAVLQLYAIAFAAMLLFTLRYGGRPPPPSDGKGQYALVTQAS